MPSNAMTSEVLNMSQPRNRRLGSPNQGPTLSLDTPGLVRLQEALRCYAEVGSDARGPGAACAAPGLCAKDLLRTRRDFERVLLPCNG